MDYCSPSDLYDHGLPRGSVPNPARLVANGGAANSTTDAFTLDQHGFSTGDAVQFRAEAGGSLPAPLLADTTYYAIALSDSRFQVSAALSGPAIDLTTNGARVLVIPPSPVPAAIAWASRVFEDLCPAHAVPLPESPVPDIVRMTVAEMAAGKLAQRAGTTSTSLSAIVDNASARLKRWASGVPIRGQNAPATHTNTAVASTAANTECFDPVGWNRFGGL